MNISPIQAYNRTNYNLKIRQNCSHTNNSMQSQQNYSYSNNISFNGGDIPLGRLVNKWNPRPELLDDLMRRLTPEQISSIKRYLTERNKPLALKLLVMTLHDDFGTDRFDREPSGCYSEIGAILREVDTYVPGDNDVDGLLSARNKDGYPRLNGTAISSILSSMAPYKVELRNLLLTMKNDDENSYRFDNSTYTYNHKLSEIAEILKNTNADNYESVVSLVKAKIDGKYRFTPFDIAFIAGFIDKGNSHILNKLLDYRYTYDNSKEFAVDNHGISSIMCNTQSPEHSYNTESNVERFDKLWTLLQSGKAECNGVKLDFYRLLCELEPKDVHYFKNEELDKMIKDLNLNQEHK